MQVLAKAWLRSLRKLFSQPQGRPSRRTRPATRLLLEGLETRLTPAPVITTIAGNGTASYGGDNGPATAAMLYLPFGTAVDSSGDVFIADTYNHCVREVVKATGNIITVAGTGTPSYNGDGGPATSSNIGYPYGVAVDAAGDLFIADSYNDRIREVVKATGDMITVAGTGAIGYSGDGAPATLALLNSPFAVAVDGSGNVFFSDQGNNRVREVVKATGTIITVAGNGSPGYSGDNGPATSATLNQPNGVAVDGSGNLYISDWHNNRVREVVKATGNIITVAGNGVAGFSGDNGPATSAELNYPGGVAVDAAGNVYVGDSSNGRVREVTKATGIITTVAGVGGRGFGGDGGSPTAAQLNLPYGVAVDGGDNIYIADSYNNRIREVVLTNGPAIGGLSAPPWTVNQPGYGGGATVTGGTAPYGNFSATGLPPGLSAAFSGSTITLSGTPTVAGTYGNVTLSVQDASGNAASLTFSITINAVPTFGSLTIPQWVAGVSGYNGYVPIIGGTGSFTLVAQSNLPPGMSAVLGGPFVSFLGIPTTPGTYNMQLTVRDATGASGSGTVSITVNAPAPGSILAIAGSYSSGYSGDGGAAKLARLYGPYSVAVDGSGDVFIADYFNSRVRELVKATGDIITVAGTGTAGFSGDGGPATSAELNYPSGVAVDAAGDLFIADNGNHRVREVVRATGNIITVAGSGSSTDSGDGGPAAAAGLTSVQSVAVDANGNVFIADAGGNRVREVLQATGTIVTVAGTGTAGYGGDNGPATAALLNQPSGVAVDASGNLYIADSNNARVREVVQATGNIVTLAGSGVAGYGGDGGLATAAELYTPRGVTVDAGGNVFIADTNNSRIREVVRSSGAIVTVAGVGGYGSGGDGGPATAAALNSPYGVAVDGGGDLFIADFSNNVVREVLDNPSPVLGPLSSAAWTVNQPGFSAMIPIVNAAPPAGATVTATGLPAGLSVALSGTVVTVTGTPTATGTYGSVTVTLLDVNGSPIASRTFSMTINAAPALGAFGWPDQWTVGRTGYSGSVPASGGTGALTLSSQANLPPGLTAVYASGFITFTGTPTTVGTFNNVRLTVKDTTGATTTGTYTITINPLPTLGAPSTTVWEANQPGFSSTVSILGGTAPMGNLSYSGLPPGLYATQSGNTITIKGTPTTAGTYSNAHLSVQDYTLATAGSTFSITIDAPGPAVTLSLTNYPTAVTAGASASFTVSALDSLGFVAPGYRGTVSLGSTDPLTGAPTTYTFTAADNGVHTFNFTLDTAGSQQLSVRDAAGISGVSAPITVSPSALNHFAVAAPQDSASYYSFNVAVSAEDAFNNTITGYAGTVHFTSSDSAATPPADYTFTNADQGTHTFAATLQTTGNQTLTATDGGVGGTATILDADYVPGLHFLFDTPSTTTAGAPFDVTVIALDEYNDVATHYDGTIAFLTNDHGSAAVVPGNYTFTAADAGVHTFAGGFTLVSAGTRSLEAADTRGYGDSTSANITVVPAALSGLSLGSFPASVVAGAAQSFTVAGVDAYGNVVTSYNGTIHFSSTDAQTVLPSDTALSNGIGTFSAVLKTVGPQSVTADDVANSALTVTQATTVDPASAAQFVVAGFPTSDTAGAAGTFTVTALDAFGNIATGYTGAVHFTSSDAQAVLPANATFTGGTGTFSATLKTAGTQSITATDTASSGINGTQNAISVNAAAASSLVVSGFPSSITAGVAANFTVTARDAYGNVATSYMGTVHLAGGDPRATLPADYTYTAADGGSHVFAATLTAAGSQTLAVSDTGSAGVGGAQWNVSVVAGATSAFVLGGLPDTQTAGVAEAFTVTATDAYGNIATGYTGTVHFSSGDSQAALPADYTFTAADAGTHSFSATLKTAGSQSVFVQDTVQYGVNGIHWGMVTAAAASWIGVYYPAATTAGAAQPLTVTAYDPYDNVATSYTGTVHVTSFDAQATLPADYTFTAADAGVHALSVTLKTAGLQGITVQDVQNGFTRTVSGIAVSAAAASRVTVGGFPSSTTAGTAGGLTVTAYDVYGNVATGYVGSVHFTSSDAQAGLPADYTFTAADQGAHTFSATLKTAGTQSLSVTDAANPGLTATQTGLTVVAGAVGKFTVGGYPATTAGTSHNFTVTATDAYGNVVAGYRGTVHFTSSDAQAGLPANYTFTAADNGVHTFSATLKTAGGQSLTATDTASSGVTGGQSGIAVTAAAATHLAVSAPANVSVGVAFSVTVTALDAYGNVATGYLGTVHFTSSDHKAVLPSNYTFVAADAGVHTFLVTLKSSGTQTLTAADTHTSSIKGSASTKVS